MRTAFIETLCELADADSRVWLLTGDLGFSVVEQFSQRFADRFLNVGVAEQNMIGVAAGLASCGNIVFVYSIANFPTMRCLEQIRNDVCYHRLPVRVVSVGAGFAYGSAGYTHFGIEDIAVMRALPGMTVLSPGDPHETRVLTRQLVNYAGPVYLRLGKAGEPCVYSEEPSLVIGKASVIRSGDDLCLLATGSMLHPTSLLAESLATQHSIQTMVVSVPTVKPLDYQAILEAATRPVLMTIEEHSITGGLGSAVAEVLAECRLSKAAFKRIGVPDQIHTTIGDQSYLRNTIIGNLEKAVLQHYRAVVG